MTGVLPIGVGVRVRYSRAWGLVGNYVVLYVTSYIYISYVFCCVCMYIYIFIFIFIFIFRFRFIFIFIFIYSNYILRV